MGNQNSCCSQQPPTTNPLFTLAGSVSVEKPVSLTEHQQAFLNSQNLFPKQLKKLTTLKMSEDHLFEGQLDERGNPMGFAIFKQKNQQSVFYGNFNQLGTEDSKLYYVLPDGSYFAGNLLTQAKIQGEYVQPQHKYRYQGQLQHSPNQSLRYIPHGKGTQDKTGSYVFSGEFNNGKRVKGKLQWAQRNYGYQYEGSFDQNELFTRKGVLKEETGTYTGDFVQGKKEGYGRYNYSGGMLFEGEYKDGKKNGTGKLYNYDGSISYEGQFKNGLPHGNGVAYSQQTSVKTQFYEGISKENHIILDQDFNLLQLAEKFESL